MAISQWHKFYRSHIAAPPGVLFELLADMPGYGRWLPSSAAKRRHRDGPLLILDIAIPAIARPLRGLIVRSFDNETLRTVAAVKTYAEAHANDAPTAEPAQEPGSRNLPPTIISCLAVDHRSCPAPTPNE
jgi:hypothetical protein